MNFQAKGFSLIELMVTLLIVSILALVVVPGFQSTLSRNRLTTTTNQLLGSFQEARSEAVSLATPINVVAIGGVWNNGWELQRADTNAVIRSFANVPDTLSINAGGGSTTITFQEIGTATPTECLSLTAPNAGTTRYIEIIASGFTESSEVNCAP